MLIKTQFNSEYISIGKTMDTTQHTVPDQHMSVRELLANHARGLPIHAQTNEGQYFGTEIPIITDLTDLQTLRDKLKENEQHTNDLISEDVNKYKSKKASEDAKQTKVPEKVLNTQTE
jgi:hypothetical protein